MAMIAAAVLTTIAAGIVMAAAAGLGGPFVKLLPDSFTPIEQFAMRLLFGTGALGLALFLLGQIIFTPLFISIVIVVCVVLNFVWWPRFGRSWIALLRPFPQRLRRCSQRSWRFLTAKRLVFLEWSSQEFFCFRLGDSRSDWAQTR